MSLIALDERAELDRRCSGGFTPTHAIQAADLLLQERIPHLVPLKNPPIEKAEHIPSTRQLSRRRWSGATSRHTRSVRAAHLLSNGDYAVMVTSAGGGYSRRQALAMTRWREDVTRDDWGTFCYVRDLETGDVWSTTFQPTRTGAEICMKRLSRPIARCSAVSTSTSKLRMEIVVSPEDSAELRRVSVTNHSGARSQSRPHELRRGRARARWCGPGASGIQQSVRRDDRRSRNAMH